MNKQEKIIRAFADGYMYKVARRGGKMGTILDIFDWLGRHPKTTAGSVATGAVGTPLLLNKLLGKSKTDREKLDAIQKKQKYEASRPEMAKWLEENMGDLGKGFAGGAGASTLYDLASGGDMNFGRALGLGLLGSGAMMGYKQYKPEIHKFFGDMLKDEGATSTVKPPEPAKAPEPKK